MLLLLSALDDAVANALQRRSVPRRPAVGRPFETWLVKLPASGAGTSVNRQPSGETSRRLLIIEDDDGIAESLAEIFAARGYHVDVARHGQEALDRVRSTGLRPDAILLDLLMPVMDGFEFLRVRSHEPLVAAAPVIIITAQPKAGRTADDWYARFEKPLPLRQLLDTVERACHRGPPV
jgi:CheY-like chemotaxis protein